MSRGQRFAFLGIAVVIAVIAVIVLADSSEDDKAPTAATATPTASAAPQEAAPQEESTPTPTPTPPPPPLLTAGKVRELEFKQGDTVRFRIRSDTADHVHVHGYDLMKDVEPGKTATMSFKATITGIFEVEFEDSGTQIAELKVEPK
jgi:heme/copper-type cytochrome/quinol oxidase subunit 2